LGRDDFIYLSGKLLKERAEHGLEIGNEGWVEMQKHLLVSHDFLTGTARLLRSVSIEEQINSLRDHN
ncbi:MAG TPA: hypothetical protein PLA01_09050, partial [Acetivibrio sp.]|nr:hypothetical protein [Acetivibrio sp.]